MNAGTRLGPYEVLGSLGAGGMGQVYRARDTKLNRDVALKVLLPEVANDPERLARFRREAQVLAALNHPHIGAIYGLEEGPAEVGRHTIALVMELVEGEDLAQRIARGPLPLDEALPIAKQIAEALEAAHEQGIIHRDLKPANIKVRADGTIKILDFGLAKAVEAGGAGGAGRAGRENPSMSPTLTAATQLGVILGTAAYMAPEQAKGKIVDRRVDIWAFGCVLYEMLAGSRPFGGEDVTDTIVSVMSKEPDWSRLPALTPPAIRVLIGRCLEKSALNRLPHIGSARLELDDAIAGKPHGGHYTVAAPVRSRHFWPLIGGSVLAAGVVTALTTWALTRPAPDPRPLIRLSAELGPDAIAGQRAIAAISRDGRRIAFQVRDKGTVRLATRLLDQPTHVVLPGTEDGYDPFFSPDGQWIAFQTLAGNKLKKVRVDGGAAVTLGDASSLRGGSWGDDGHIVVAPQATGGLVILPAGGGASQPLTTLANNERTHRWPQVLPGSQLVLFTASTSTSEWETADIRAVSRADGKIATLVKGAYFGRYLAGHLLYVSQRTLFAVTFDPATLRVGATPVPVLDDLTSERVNGAGWFDLSDTGMFVYRSGKGEDTVAISWLDSTGTIERLSPSAADLYATPRLSPNGQRLAMAVGNRTESDIHVYDITRDAMSRVTFSARGNVKPLWTPDGNHLVYHSPLDMTLSWIRADGGGEPQLLLQGKSIVDATAFSPDGRYLVYYTAPGPDQNDIFRLPLDLTDPARPKPGPPEPLVTGPATEGEPKVSPDGRWLSYSSNESGRAEVYVRPFGPNAPGKWQISNAGGGYSVWSKDGRTLYYLGLDRLIMAVDYTATKDAFQPGRPRLWSTRFIRQTPAGMPPLDLAPDGKRFAIVVSDADGRGDGPTTPHATFLFNFIDELRRRVR